MKTPREEAEDALNSGAQLTADQFAALFSPEIVGASVANTSTSIRQTLHREAGLGMPPGKLLIDPSVRAPRAVVEARVATLNPNEIWRRMEGMTGHRPSINKLDIHVYEHPKYTEKQAALNMSGKQILGTSPSGNRIMLHSHEQTHPNTLMVNDAFLSHMPDEARGVVFHEFGHLWTQAMLLHTEAYSEGFAELFRTAAAQQEGASWKQALGGQPYQVLHGEKEPQLIHAIKCDPPIEIEINGRYIVCNRLIQLLGGIDERKLRGIAKACDVPVSPAKVRPLKYILEAIERETGVRGFAENFLHDPVLRPGNLTPGKKAFAYHNAAGNYISIRSFDVTDTAPLYGQSRQTFERPESVTRIHVDGAHFHLKGPQVRDVPCTIRIIHPRGIEMRMSYKGIMDLTPLKLMELGKQGGYSWPAGTTQFEFAIEGERPVMLQQTLTISEEEHRALCAQLGLPVR